MTIDKKEIVATMAYMIGVKREILMQYYEAECKELLEELFNDKAATIIRYLSRLRTSLLLHFKKTDYEIRYNLANLDRLEEWYDKENIRQLEKWDIQIIQVNHTSEKYMMDFTRLINEHISDCEHLFRDWINFEYIKSLFYIPKYTKKNVLKAEFELFMKNRNKYPFQMYIHWEPRDSGNILYSDKKFLDIVYGQHNERFWDNSKVKDADEETKADIYEFINAGYKVAIAVDCENSDVFKLYGVLRNLNSDELSRIEKIMLFDDVHTSEAWKCLNKYTKIPVEHIEVERVTSRKSLVDIKMTTGVCMAFYKQDIDSFILCSSDSDFWGLISSLPDANFLVMYEYSKCGQSIKDAMEAHGIANCAMDNFYTGNASDLKKKVLLDRLEYYYPKIVGMNGRELVKQIYEDTRINGTEAEIENFYNKYIKTLRLKIDSSGVFRIETT